MRILDDFIHTQTAQLGRDRSLLLEQRIQILLQPKPRWWPTWFYHYTIRRLLVVVEHESHSHYDIA